VSSPCDGVVTDVAERNRYELRLDGELIGFLTYGRRDGRLVLTHTEIDQGYEGRGFGTRLVLAALEDARRQEVVVVPLCPFVAYQLEVHPEYQDLLGEP
jgi:predicted GNAT family acetyltransferase